MKKLSLFIIATLFSAGLVYAQEWIHTDGPYGGSVWALHSDSEGHVWAGTLSHGIYRSTDNGENWMQTNLDDVSVYQFAVAPDGNMFAATQNGIYRSNDTGNTWRRASTGLSETKAQSIAISENGTLFTAILNAGIYRSTDGGDNWQAVNNGIELEFGYSVLVDGATVYAGVTNRVYVSTNGGDSWTRKSTDFGFARVNSLITVDGVLFAGTQEGIFKSEDQAETWTEVSSGLSDNIIYELGKDGSGNLLAATRGGIYRSTNSGNSWSLLGESESMVYSLSVNPENTFIGTNEGVYYWQQ